MGWFIFLAVTIPLLGVLAWVVLDESFVRVEPGQLGLLLVKGRATDRVLEPGPHWVPALRRRMMLTYPSLELSYRAGAEDGDPAAELERSGPAVRATLADRSEASVAFTVRFRLDTGQLRQVHERFGADGIWSAVRDVAEATVRDELLGVEVEEVFAPGRASLEVALGERVGDALREVGFVVAAFRLGAVDLGATGDVIQATTRARHELAREQAEAEVRRARARIDADLAAFVDTAGAELALRYREFESWRELARASRSVVRVASRPLAPEPVADTGAGELTAEEER
jgi:regulator of protease activity HflC (stomatin/prohibitin superfamily)